MGPEVVKNCVAEVPLWQRYADQFPVRENLVYLNHAAVAPLPRRCADALEHLAEDCLQYGSLHYSEWLAVYEGLRVAAARLMNADREEGCADVRTNRPSGICGNPGKTVRSY